MKQVSVQLSVELDVGDVIEEIVYDDMNIKCVKLIYILKVQHD